MALKYDCPRCGNLIIVKFLKVGEMASCKTCHAESMVPESAINTEEETPLVSPVVQHNQIPIINESIEPLPVLPLGKLLSMTIDIFADNKRIFIILGSIYCLLSIISNILDMPIFSNSGNVIFPILNYIFMTLVMISGIPIIIAANDEASSGKAGTLYKETLGLIIPLSDNWRYFRIECSAFRVMPDNSSHNCICMV